MSIDYTALATALVFLDINGIEIDDPNEELYEIMMKTANGKYRKDDIAVAFRKLHVKAKK